MARCEKIKDKALRNPKGLRFNELRYLAECHGFGLKRMRGSHFVYAHAAYPRPIPFQPRRDGSAKEYQVRQLLQAIDAIEHGTDR